MTEEPTTDKAADSRMLESGNARSRPAPRPGAGCANLEHSPAHILVVDDDAQVRESLAEVLIQEHYSVSLASNGRDAVRQFLDGVPDLILLDVNMPDVTGWKTSQVVAQLNPQVPVIIITAGSGQARRAADLGVNAFLEKPLNISLLLRTIRKLLDQPESTHFESVLSACRTHDLLSSQG